MLEYKGSFLPMAMAWLPDKTALSYYTCLALLLLAFKEKKDEIQSMYGRSTLRLRKIKCDFEASIHIGWGMFSLSGCYFHYTQVWPLECLDLFKILSQAIWRDSLTLQRDYGKGDIDEMMFLKTIGSLTDRKKVGNLQAVTGEPPATGLEGGLPAISGENGSLRFKIISEILPL